jgi:hypothetical protein
MAYTPELSLRSSCTLRRISWALGVPMTKCIESVSSSCHWSWTGRRSAGVAGTEPNARSALLTRHLPTSHNDTI